MMGWVVEGFRWAFSTSCINCHLQAEMSTKMSLITITYVNFFLPVCIYASWGTYKKKKKTKPEYHLFLLYIVLHFWVKFSRCLSDLQELMKWQSPFLNQGLWGNSHGFMWSLRNLLLCIVALKLDRKGVYTGETTLLLFPKTCFESIKWKLMVTFVFQIPIPPFPP